MIIKALWDNRIAESLINADNPNTAIYDLLDTIEYAKGDNAELQFCDELYYQMVNDTSFINWLYDKNSSPETADAKKELVRLIEKSERISNEQYENILSAVENKDIKDELIISFCMVQDNMLYIYTIKQYLQAKQWYLANFINKDDFINEAISCFPNLFFHSNVSSSINTLNTDFRIVRPIIVEHLRSLNNFYQDASLAAGQGGSFHQIASKFTELYKIECSTQSDRNSVQQLYYSFEKDNAEEKERLCCELHTKLKWPDMDHNRQDRIYFHPGKSDIENGKILIVHIGRHK